MSTTNISMPDLGLLDKPGVGYDDRPPQEPVPAGYHTADITEFRDSKGGTYPRDDEGATQRTLILAIKIAEGEYAGRLTFVRGNYHPEFLTAEWINRVTELNKSQTLWTNGTTEEKQAFFTQRLIGSLRKAAKAQGRDFTANGAGMNVDAITNLRCRTNLQIKTDETGQYPPKNELNGFNPFDAVKS